MEEHNQMREDQKVKEINDLKNELHEMEKLCTREIFSEQSRVETEQRQCEHQLLGKDEIIRQKDS